MLNNVLPNTVLLVQPFIKNLFRNHVFFESYRLLHFVISQIVWSNPLQISLRILKNVIPGDLFANRLGSDYFSVFMKIVSIILLKLWRAYRICWVIVGDCFWFQGKVLIFLKRLSFHHRICNFRWLSWWNGRISENFFSDRLQSTPRCLIFGPWQIQVAIFILLARFTISLHFPRRYKILFNIDIQPWFRQGHTYWHLLTLYEPVLGSYISYIRIPLLLPTTKITHSKQWMGSWLDWNFFIILWHFI